MNKDKEDGIKNMTPSFIFHTLIEFKEVNSDNDDILIHYRASSRTSDVDFMQCNCSDCMCLSLCFFSYFQLT